MSAPRANLIREPLCCRRCNKVLSEVLMVADVSIYMQIQSDHGRKRVTVGPLPNFIICEDCGDRWENPTLHKPPEFMALMPYFRQFVEAIPRAPLPARDFGAVRR